MNLDTERESGWRVERLYQLKTSDLASSDHLLSLTVLCVLYPFVCTHMLVILCHPAFAFVNHDFNGTSHCILPSIIAVAYLLCFLEYTPNLLLLLRLWTTAFFWSKQRPGLRYSALLSQNNSQQTLGRGGLQSSPVWSIVLSIYFAATVDVFRDAVAFDLYQYHTDSPLLFFVFFFVVLDHELFILEKEPLIHPCVLLMVYEGCVWFWCLGCHSLLQPRWLRSPPSAAEVSAACLDSRSGDGGRREDYHLNRSETLDRLCKRWKMANQYMSFTDLIEQHYTFNTVL